MNVKIARKDASGWVGADIKVLEGEYKDERGVVTNSLPAADGSVWSLHVRLVRFPKMELPLIVSPSEVERIGLN